MPNVSVDYAAVSAVAAQLVNIATQVATTLTQARTQVSNLVTSQDLHLDATSPALNTAYQNFDTMLQKNIEGIKGFSDQFNAIVKQFQAMDEAMRNSLTKQA